VGRGCEKKKNTFFLENVHPPHVFIEKTCPPHIFYSENVPPLHFHLKNVYPHDVFFLHFFDFPIRRDSWTATPAMILLQLHASALIINHASAHYY